ncbi:unnamed protein product [Rhodiola kirilowii]
MSNLAQNVSELKGDSGRLPSQSIPNPKGNVSTMAVVDVDAVLKESAYWVNKMLAVGRHIEAENSEIEADSDQIADEEHFNAVRGQIKCPSPAEINGEAPAEDQTATDDEHVTSADEEHFSGPRVEHLKCSSPVIWSEMNSKTDTFSSFSMQIIAPKDHTIDKDELGSMLEARHERNDPMMERPVVASYEAPPGKSKDPGAFTVTCGVGETLIHHCLIDLGVAINAMPYSLYCSLKLGPLKPPKLMVELGNKSIIHPIGLLEDLTLRVGDLFVPADFYVLQMGDARDDDPPALILGRPFLFATKAKIDMGSDLLSLTYGGKASNFHIYEDADRPWMKKPPEIVNTSCLGALIPDPPDETGCAAGPVATIKVSSQTRRM